MEGAGGFIYGKQKRPRKRPNTGKELPRPDAKEPPPDPSSLFDTHATEGDFTFRVGE